MKINLGRISEKDKAVLADFYESATYQVFKKFFIDNGQIVLAKKALFSTEEVKLQSQGRVLQLKDIHDTLAEINKKENKKRDS